MEKNFEELNEWFEKQMAACGDEQKKLLFDDRADEANLMKVKANVYEICKTVFGVFKKVKPEDKLFEEYLKKLEEFKATWEASRKKADEHGDVQKSVIEHIKLEALADVKNRFMKLGENQNA